MGSELRNDELQTVIARLKTNWKTALPEWNRTSDLPGVEPSANVCVELDRTVAAVTVEERKSSSFAWVRTAFAKVGIVVLAIMMAFLLRRPF